MISIIIPTYNRNDLLSKCLELLDPKIQSCSYQYEIIISDDSKDNRAKELIQGIHSFAKWVEGPKKGPAANRNNGAKQAKGKWLLFIDDDCLPGTDIVDQYYKAIKDKPGIEVFEGCIKADRDKRSFLEESPVNETGGHLWSCNFMIRKSLFDDLHGFDEGFPFAAMEDVELNYRLKRAGHNVSFIKDAVVVHPWRAIKNPYQLGQKRFKSILYYLEKHPEEKKKINTVFFLRYSLAGMKAIFTKSLKYNFRGVSGPLTGIMLDFYCAAYIYFFNKRNASGS